MNEVVTFSPITLTITTVDEALKAKSLLDYLIEPGVYLDLAREIMNNYPEASSEWIRCYSWKYTDETFKFHVNYPDDDEDVSRDVTITVLQVAQTIPLFLNMWKFKKWGMYDMEPSMDPSDWDAIYNDVCLQVLFFGDMIYG